MKVSLFRWVFIAWSAFLLVLSTFFPGPTVGASAEWFNGHYRFAGGTTPLALAIAATVITLYLLLLRSVPPEAGKPLPGLFRRYLAFWIDFILAMSCVGPIVGLLPTIVEWRRTGIFRWTIDRDSYVSGDLIQSIVSLLLALVALLAYYSLPLTRRRPSPGACVFRYQVVSELGDGLSYRSAVLRTLLGFIAVAGAPFALFIRRDRKNGKFWLDEVFDTRAVLSG